MGRIKHAILTRASCKVGPLPRPSQTDQNSPRQGVALVHSRRAPCCLGIFKSRSIDSSFRTWESYSSTCYSRRWSKLMITSYSSNIPLYLSSRFTWYNGWRWNLCEALIFEVSNVLVETRQKSFSLFNTHKGMHPDLRDRFTYAATLHCKQIVMLTGNEWQVKSIHLVQCSYCGHTNFLRRSLTWVEFHWYMLLGLYASGFAC